LGSWFLFIVVPGAALGYFVWSYRRKAAERDAESEARFRKLLEPAAAAGLPQAPPAAAVRASSVSSPPAQPFVTRGALIEGPGKLLYYLLKTGLPEHEVLARVSLAAVVEVPGAARDSAEQRRLAQQVLDFVVCDKTFRPVAAVELTRSGGALAAEAAKYKTTCLASAGIHHIALAADALPKKDALRALVLAAKDSIST
jgi:hypothetical protein